MDKVAYYKEEIYKRAESNEDYWNRYQAFYDAEYPTYESAKRELKSTGLGALGGGTLGATLGGAIRKSLGRKGAAYPVGLGAVGALAGGATGRAHSRLKDMAEAERRFNEL